MNMVMCIDPWVGLKAGMCVRGGGSLLLVGVPGGRFALFRGGTNLNECKIFWEVWSFFFGEGVVAKLGVPVVGVIVVGWFWSCRRAASPLRCFQESYSVKTSTSKYPSVLSPIRALPSYTSTNFSLSDSSDEADTRLNSSRSLRSRSPPAPISSLWLRVRKQKGNKAIRKQLKQISN